MHWKYPLLACLLFVVPRPVRAEEVEAEEPPEPKIQLTTAPAPPAVQRTYHVHEGFYARLSFGGGHSVSHFNTEGADFDLRGTGFSGGADLLIGGSPAPGIAIGGAFLSNLAFSNSYEANDVDFGNRNLSTFLIGPFVDGFPNPKKGFHLGLALGLGPAMLEAGNSDDGLAAVTGFGGAGWLGYDFWVAEEWSAGLLYRFGANVAVDENELGQSTSVVGLTNTFMLTAVLH